MILEPQLSFPKENWIEYAKELQEENTQHVTRIKELEAIIASMSDENESISGIVVEIGEKDARIKQLEDWLVEVHAKHIPATCRYDDMEGECAFGNDGWCKNCKQKDRMRERAREQLQAEGKL